MASAEHGPSRRPDLAVSERARPAAAPGGPDWASSHLVRLPSQRYPNTPPAKSRTAPSPAPTVRTTPRASVRRPARVGGGAARSSHAPPPATTRNPAAVSTQAAV